MSRSPLAPPERQLSTDACQSTATLSSSGALPPPPPQSAAINAGESAETTSGDVETEQPGGPPLTSPADPLTRQTSASRSAAAGSTAIAGTSPAASSSTANAHGSEWDPQFIPFDDPTPEREIIIGPDNLPPPLWTRFVYPDDPPAQWPKLSRASPEETLAALKELGIDGDLAAYLVNVEGLWIGSVGVLARLQGSYDDKRTDKEQAIVQEEKARAEEQEERDTEQDAIIAAYQRDLFEKERRMEQEEKLYEALEDYEQGSDFDADDYEDEYDEDEKDGDDRDDDSNGDDDDRASSDGGTVFRSQARSSAKGKVKATTVPESPHQVAHEDNVGGIPIRDFGERTGVDIGSGGIPLAHWELEGKRDPDPESVLKHLANINLNEEAARFLVKEDNLLAEQVAQSAALEASYLAEKQKREAAMEKKQREIQEAHELSLLLKEHAEIKTAWFYTRSYDEEEDDADFMDHGDSHVDGDEGNNGEASDEDRRDKDWDLYADADEE